MDKQQQLILAHSSTLELEKRLRTLDSVYHVTEDRQTRQKMLLFIDEIKIELKQRGLNVRNSRR